jgi:ketosteroid isomerase-like protein
VSTELVRRSTELTNGDGQVGDEELAEIFAPDVVLDFTARIFNPRVYEGYEGLRQFYAESREVWEEVAVTLDEVIEEGDRYLVLTRVRSRGRGSGIELEAPGAAIWSAAGGRLSHYRLLGELDRDQALAMFRQGT